MATTMTSELLGLKPGETRHYRSESGHGGGVTVSYEREQSHGDNGSAVPGAYTGRFRVTYPNGAESVHEHGPHATTLGAQKRGASPDARMWAADHAARAVTRHIFSAQMGFNDRRNGSRGERIDPPSYLDAHRFGE